MLFLSFVFTERMAKALPSELMHYIQSFLHASDRLRLLAIFEGMWPFRRTKKWKRFASCRNGELPQDASQIVSRREVLQLYLDGEIARHTDTDEFLWRWCTSASSLENDSVRLYNITQKTQHNTERHFTEEWQTYGGRLETQDGRSLEVKIPRGFHSHLLDHVIAKRYGRGERYRNYGYGDFDHY